MLNALKLGVCSKINVTFSFAFSSRYAKTRTSNFRKVVQQHTEGMVGSIIRILWEIYFFKQWNNSEHPLWTDKVIAMRLVYCTIFWTQCTLWLKKTDPQTATI